MFDNVDGSPKIEKKTPNIIRIVVRIILLILGLCIERKIVFWIKRNYVIKFVVNPKSVSFLLADAFSGLDIVHIVFIDLGYHQEGKK